MRTDTPTPPPAEAAPQARGEAPGTVHLICGLWRDEPARAFVSETRTNGSREYVPADLLAAERTAREAAEAERDEARVFMAEMRDDLDAYGDREEEALARATAAEAESARLREALAAARADALREAEAVVRFYADVDVLTPKRDGRPKARFTAHEVGVHVRSAARDMLSRIAALARAAAEEPRNGG